MPLYPDLVKDRLNAPVGMRSRCDICPLNGKRKVGHDGPLDAEHIAIYEAPGKDEEEWLVTKGVKYGRPLVGATGYYVKVRNLAPVGLVELTPGRRPEYPRIGRMNIHLMNVAMCRPPKNKIDSKEGKAAVRCCANSARYILNRALERNPNISLHPAGATALTLLRGRKTGIEAYRGRPTGPHTNFRLEYEPEEEIEKYVLRGKKPKEEWWNDFVVWLKTFLKFYRATTRFVERQRQKDVEAAILSSNEWLLDWSKLWKKQKAAVAASLRKASGGTVSTTRIGRRGSQKEKPICK